MNLLYLYIFIGTLTTLISLLRYKNKEKHIAEEVQDKLHELNNDNSISFKSADLIGHLLAFIVGTLFWPVIVLKKILRK